MFWYINILIYRCINICLIFLIHAKTCLSVRAFSWLSTSTAPNAHILYFLISTYFCKTLYTHLHNIPAISLTVNRRFSMTVWCTKSTISSVLAVFGRPERSSSKKLVRPRLPSPTQLVLTLVDEKKLHRIQSATHFLFLKSLSYLIALLFDVRLEDVEWILFYVFVRKHDIPTDSVSLIITTNSKLRLALASKVVTKSELWWRLLHRNVGSNNCSNGNYVWIILQYFWLISPTHKIAPKDKQSKQNNTKENWQKCSSCLLILEPFLLGTKHKGKETIRWDFDKVWHTVCVTFYHSL